MMIQIDFHFFKAAEQRSCPSSTHNTAFLPEIRAAVDATPACMYIHENGDLFTYAFNIQY